MTASPQRSSYIRAQVDPLRNNLRFSRHVTTPRQYLATDLSLVKHALLSTFLKFNRELTASRNVTRSSQSLKKLGIQGVELTKRTINLLGGFESEDRKRVPESWRARIEPSSEGVYARIGTDSRSERSRALRGLYVIIDLERMRGRDPREVAKAALRGGASTLQLRGKIADDGIILKLARHLGDLCQAFGAMLVINDNAAIARLSSADGLHVGQTDLPIKEAREILSSEQIVGRSNATVKEALESEAQSADYVAVGAIYPTDTKLNTRPAGLETLSQIKHLVRVPIVAIGGIKPENASAVLNAGADAICVTTAVTEADDPEAAARQLVQLMAKGGSVA